MDGYTCFRWAAGFTGISSAVLGSASLRFRFRAALLDALAREILRFLVFVRPGEGWLGG